METKNFTKVVCENCGAEIIIPTNGGKVTTGKVVGKDSNLGTIVSPAYGGDNGTVRFENNTKATTNFNVKNALDMLKSTVKGNKRLLDMLESVNTEIQNNGWVDVNGIVRRWVPAQFLRMFFSNSGFHQSLKWKGYGYSWKVLINDITIQMRDMEHKDMEDALDRSRFYNPTIAYKMAEDYIAALCKWFKNAEKRNCRGKKYVKLVCSLNHGKGVFVNDFQECVETPLKRAALLIKDSRTPVQLLVAIQNFKGLIDSIKFTPKMSNAFINSYKAAGAYYTMKDLIKFEGCLAKGAKNADESLDILEQVFNGAVKNDIAEYGYMMLGVTKSFLEYNNFDYIKTTKGWADQSEARRAMREQSKKNRRVRK